MSLFRVNKPTYERDRVGEFERFDERDNVFARADLFRYFADDSEPRRSYYDSHPEHLEYDRLTAGLPGLGRYGGDHDWAYSIPFEFCGNIAGERFVDGEQSSSRREPGPTEAARLVKERARALGADLVGTGPLNPEWVYSHVGRSFGNAEGFEPWGTPVDPRRHRHAVAMGFEMERDLTRAAPEFPTLAATALAYGQSAWVAVRLAAYIRGLGYSARAHHVYNYRVLVVPVAVDCGLGELSRAGFLLTREYGLGLRLSAVTTDLPLAHDPPADIGVQAFCERCRVCAENCPSGAIPKGRKTEHRGVMKWKLDEEKCYRYWHAVGTDCSICMSTCPWTRPRTWLHRGVSILASAKGPHQSLLVMGARLLYGSPELPGNARAVGMSSLRPTRLGRHMRAMASAVAFLAMAGVAIGVLAGVGRPSAGASELPGAVAVDGAPSLGASPAASWSAYGLWLAWTLLGVAVVWTLAAEREPRASLISAAIFGAVTALSLALLARAGLLA